MVHLCAMQFRDVVGQHAAKEGLLTAIEAGRLPHALLLAGPEGAGGLPLARALAQYLFCEAPAGGDSCGTCPGCRKVARLEHPDLHLSFPSLKKERTAALSRNYLTEFREFIGAHPYGTTYDWLQALGADNKQGNLTAEECREIIDALNLKSYEGGRKVLLLWRPEYLDKEGNILLKLIEEPPAGTVMLFVAEEPNDMLPTLLSRMQTVRLPPLPASDIADALVAREIVPDARTAGTVALAAGGSYAEALQLASGGGEDLFPQFRDWFNAIFRNLGPQLSRFAEEGAKEGRERAKAFLQYAIHLLEAALRQRYAPERRPALPQEEAEFVRKLAGQPAASHETLAAMTREIADAQYRIERNANAKATLHALGIRLSRIVRSASRAA